MNAFIETFEMCLIAIVMPCKTLLFTVHNYLTKRDYTYSIDDICDLGILICIIVWIYTYIAWSSEPVGDYAKAYATTKV